MGDMSSCSRLPVGTIKLTGKLQHRGPWLLPLISTIIIRAMPVDKHLRDPLKGLLLWPD